MDRGGVAPELARHERQIDSAFEWHVQRYVLLAAGTEVLPMDLRQPVDEAGDAPKEIGKELLAVANGLVGPAGVEDEARLVIGVEEVEKLGRMFEHGPRPTVLHRERQIGIQCLNTIETVEQSVQMRGRIG